MLNYKTRITLILNINNLKLLIFSNNYVYIISMTVSKNIISETSIYTRKIDKVIDNVEVIYIPVL